MASTEMLRGERTLTGTLTYEPDAGLLDAGPNGAATTLAAVRVLGPIEASSSDGSRLELGPLRHRAVLAVLALRANRPVSPDAMVEVLWGQDAPASARKL